MSLFWKYLGAGFRVYIHLGAVALVTSPFTYAVSIIPFSGFWGGLGKLFFVVVSIAVLGFAYVKLASIFWNAEELGMLPEKDDVDTDEVEVVNSV